MRTLEEIQSAFENNELITRDEERLLYMHAFKKNGKHTGRFSKQKDKNKNSIPTLRKDKFAEQDQAASITRSVSP